MFELRRDPVTGWWSAIVSRLKRERVEFLERYPGLLPEIVAAVS